MRGQSRSWIVLGIGILSAVLVTALLAFTDGRQSSSTTEAVITLADSTQAQDAVVAARTVERHHAVLQAKLGKAKQEAKQAKKAAATANVRLQNAQDRIDELNAQVRHLRHQLEIKRAAKRAAARRATHQHTSSQSPPHRGWAIPAYIVMCESGGNYRAENPSSSASGAYQILDTTWVAYGGQASGTSHAAYASPGWQDAIAAKIWNGGAGASQWTCA